MQTLPTLVLGYLTVVLAGAAGIRPTDLRCEYLRDPLGIDSTQPRLSCVLEVDSDAGRNQSQSAYQILVAGSAEALKNDRGDLWASGKVNSRQSIQLPYQGKRLNSGQRCFWKIRVYDREGKPSAWSPPACWSMGLLSPADWKAKWIGWGKDEPTSGLGNSGEERRLPARWLRKDFKANKKVA